jgi:tripartite-type tricarboxylate transporter receptor subunit TctC
MRHAAPSVAPPAAKPTTSVTNLGRTVVVENRAGAGGNLAHQYVSKAAPDGSMILLGSIGPLAIAPHLMNVGYDAQKDLASLTM